MSNHMTRKAIITASLCLIMASTAKSDEWTLDSCISYAIAHNINIKSHQLESASSELSVTEAKDAFLPQLEAGASQSFNFGRGLTSDNTYADRNTSQLGWNVNLSLPLFQGLSAKRRLDYAKANLCAVLEQAEAAKDDVTLQVIAQYLQALYCAELHEVALEQVRISKVELERRQILLDAGKIPALDLTQARSQLAQDELTAVTTDNDRRLALVDLAQLLQLPEADGFNISPLPDSLSIIPNAREIYASALRNNHALKASSLAIAAADKNISLAKSGYLPRLSLNAGLGSSYYNISGMDNAPFHRQMRDNFNKSIGFTLSIPIFDAFSTRNSVRRANIQHMNAKLQYEDARSNLYKSIQQAYFKADAARNKLSAATIAKEAAHEALEAMQEKYNYGRANATEFEEAKSTYIKASSEVVQAKYESILRLRILRFYGKQD